MSETVKIRGYVSHKIESNDPHDRSKDIIEVRCLDSGAARDDFHSMAELYEHRCMLFALAAQVGQLPVYKLKTDEDWFIAGVLLDGDQVGYHLPIYMWNMIESNCEPPEYDGHTSLDAISRIQQFIQSRIAK